MDKSLISVVLSVYNAAPYLEECLSALAKQTYSPIEFWLADDGSSDNSRAILDRWAAKDSRFKTDHNEENLGKIKTINRLLKEKANGEFLSVHDADDYSAPNRFELQINFLLAHPTFGFCGTAYETITAKGQRIAVHQKESDPKIIKAQIAQHNQFCGATMIYRASLFQKVGGYRQFFNRIGNEDYDLSYRMLELELGGNLPNNLYAYRQLNNSFSKTLKAENAMGHKLVQWLAQERKEKGQDALQLEQEERASAQLQELCQPYYQETDLLYREYAAAYMYQQLYRSAFYAALQSIKINPKKLINYRTAFYILRKANIKLVF